MNTPGYLPDGRPDYSTMVVPVLPDGRPDLGSMTTDEIAYWFIHNDTSAVLSAPEDSYPAERRIVVTFRVEPDLVDRLNQLAGRDREGRSGLLRRAVVEYLERHEARVGSVEDAA